MTTALQEKINTAIRYSDQEDAINILSTLSKSGELDMNDTNVIKLFYLRINSLSTNQLVEVMKKSVLVAYDIEDYDLASKLKEYCVQYNFAPGEVELCGKIISLLESNEENIGNDPINVKSDRLTPTIGHWVDDYEYNLGPKKRDALALIQYLNTSPNIKVLSSRQKVVLKSILELYDYCNDTVDMWSQLPNEIDDQQLEKMPQKFDWTTMVLGLDESADAPYVPIETPQVESTPEVQKEPTTYLKPNPIPKTKSVKAPSIVRITKPAAKITDTDSFRVVPNPNLTVNQNQPSVKVPESYVANPADIHDLVNKKPKPRLGVVMDPTNIKLDEEKQRINLERAAQEKRNQADAIQQKLAELRSRKNTK